MKTALASLKLPRIAKLESFCIIYGIRAKIPRTMCLATPVKIVSIEGDEAEAEIAGVRRRISIALTPEAKMGDYVLLHTGYAIGVVDEVEAKETLELLEEIASLSEVH